MELRQGPGSVTIMRRIVSVALVWSLGWLVGTSFSATAHIADRNQSHGDCTSDPGSGGYNWRLHGTGNNDNCNGHDPNPDNRDWITTNGGQDEVRGEGGADLLDGGDEADNLYGGANGSTTEYVKGESGGGAVCSPPPGPTCERIRGGEGPDSVTDKAGPNDGLPLDEDRACDGPGKDVVSVFDGDINDVVDCLCDAGNDDKVQIDVATTGDSDVLHRGTSCSF